MFDALNFARSRAEAEAEGVYIGGWSLIDAFTLATEANSEKKDKVQQVNVLMDWTPAEEKRLVRTLDMRVLFPCWLIYFLAYLDRINVGAVNVLQAGTSDSLANSLGFHGNQYNWSISITYFPSLLVLIPANILIKKVSAKYFLPFCMAALGTIVACFAAVRTVPELMIARFFLGIPEGPIVAGCVLYFSFWYKPSERALRIGIFHSAAALATGCGGFIANGVDALNGHLGMESWRWLFLIEGVIAASCSIPVFLLMLTFPETSSALSERQRYIAVNRFGRGSTRSTDATWDSLTARQVFTRPSTWIFFLGYVCTSIPESGIISFLPTILNSELKFSTHKSNAYSSAISFVNVVAFPLWAWHSDLTRERIWHMLIPILVSCPCYILFTYVGSTPETRANLGGIAPLALYGTTFLANKLAVLQPAALGYRTATLYGAAEQALGGPITLVGLVVSSIVGPQIFATTTKPFYFPGFTTACACLAVAFTCYASLPLVLLLEAKHRKRKTGHYMPLGALEDALAAQVVETVLENERYMANIEAKDDGRGTHIANIELSEKC